MTFVVGMWVTSSVVVFSALLCPGRQVATRSSPTPSTPPFGWLGLSPGPKWHRARCGWGGQVVHGQGSWLNFTQVLNFPQPPHFHLHFPHIILLPSSCTPAWPRHAPCDLLPPSAGPLRRGHFVLVFPPNPSPLQFTIIWGNWWLPLWVGRGFARCHLAWWSFHCQSRVDFTFLCLNWAKRSFLCSPELGARKNTNLFPFKNAKKT